MEITEKEIEDIINYANQLPTQYGMNLLMFIQGVKKRNLDEQVKEEKKEIVKINNNEATG